MVGSLQVVLPSRHRGGELIVEHHDETKTFRHTKASSTSPTLVAFYADCVHEVKPVQNGYRIVLSHHLVVERRPDVTVSVAPRQVTALAKALRKHFATKRPTSRFSRRPPERPQRFAYLLDHAYSSRGLSWETLKQGDRESAEALRLAAERIDAHASLMLANVHEIYSCEPTDPPWGRGRRRIGYRYDPIDPATLELGEFCDESIELVDGVDADGNPSPPLPPAINDRDIAMARPSRDLAPYRAEHEGWMGNYGDTIDRWYHRAAVVIWPRALDFALRAEGDPGWAIRQILDSNVLDERLDAITPTKEWRRLATSNPSFLPDLLDLAARLSSRDRVLELLSPFGVSLLTPKALPLLARAIARHGTRFATTLFDRWQKHYEDTRPWHHHLGALCAELLQHGASSELATTLVADQVERFTARYERPHFHYPGYDRKERAAIAAHIRDLVEAATATDALTARQALITFILERPRTFPADLIAELLVAWRSDQRPAELRAHGLEPLYRSARQRLDAACRAPARAAGDWSIDHPLTCPCDLCAELATFLASPTDVTHRWPLNKERRKHIHPELDAARLPVTHHTERRGSPYTLVLTK